MKEDFDELEFHEGEKPYNIRHRSFYFAQEVIGFVRDSKFDKVFSSLFDQLVRSATSIGANLVEGKGGSSKKDWKKYLAIALKSANETKYWLCLIRDTQDIDRKKVELLLNEAKEISKIIARIIINSESKTG